MTGGPVFPESTLSGARKAFLHACLGRGDAAIAAWLEFERRQGGLRAALRGGDAEDFKAALPLLEASRRRCGLEISADLATALRTASLREEKRAARIASVSLDVLRRLERAEVAPIVLPEPALADTHYPHPALRHSSALRLLLPRRARGDAARALRNLGLREATQAEAAARPGCPDLHLVHESGLPVILAERVLPTPYRDAPFEIWGARRMPYTVRTASGGQTTGASTLCAGHALLEVCARGSRAGRGTSLVWVSDAFFLAEALADADFEIALRGGGRAGLALPLCGLLRFLAERLGAPIPASFLHAADDAVRHAGRDARRAAFLAARAAAGYESLPVLRAAQSWAERLEILGFALFPTPEPFATGTRARAGAGSLRELSRLPARALRLAGRQLTGSAAAFREPRG